MFFILYFDILVLFLNQNPHILTFFHEFQDLLLILLLLLITMISTFLFWMNRGNPYNSSHHHDSVWFLVITWIWFSQQGNTIFHCLWSLERFAGSDPLDCVLRYMLVLSHHFWVEWTKNWEWLIYCFFRCFFESFNSYWFMKGQMFVVICRSF